MAQDTIDIAKFAVDTAVTIKDLKYNISELSKELAKADIGSDHYKDTLKELNVNQAALRNAMNGTTDSLENIARAAKAADVQFDEQNQLIKNEALSYNELVKKMADLTKAYRAATSDAERLDLSTKIKSINDQLKEMDASRGVFGRNVGDYFNQITKPLVDVINKLPKGLQGIATGIKNTGDALGVMGKQPVLGVVMLLAPIITKIVEGLQDNETALQGVNKILKSLEPVMQFFEGILQKIADLFVKAVDWLVQFGEQSGISFKKIIAGAVGVGNVILQFLLTPIKNVIAGAKSLGEVFQQVFKGQFKEAAATAKQAVKDIGDNFKHGLDFQGNFKAGQDFAEQMIGGMKSKKVKESAKAAGKEVAEDFMAGVREHIAELQAVAEAERIAEEDLWIWDPDGEISKQNEDFFNQQIENLKAADAKRLEEEKRMAAEEKALADAEMERQKQLAEARQQYLTTVGNVFSALADIYESTDEEDEKSAANAKALRTAGAILSTLSGAVSAYTSTWAAAELPVSAKMVLAPVNSAAVLAAGYAQIKKMNAVKVGNSGTASVSSSALTSAPAYNPSIPQMRSVTGKAEKAQGNRVYLVYSDLEIMQNGVRVQAKETTF